MPRSRSYAESTIAERVCCGLFSSHVRLVTTVAGLYGSVFSLVCCATAAYLAYNDESDAQAVSYPGVALVCALSLFLCIQIWTLRPIRTRLCGRLFYYVFIFVLSFGTAILRGVQHTSSRATSAVTFSLLCMAWILCALYLELCSGRELMYDDESDEEAELSEKVRARSLPGHLVRLYWPPLKRRCKVYVCCPLVTLITVLLCVGLFAQAVASTIGGATYFFTEEIVGGEMWTVVTLLEDGETTSTTELFLRCTGPQEDSTQSLVLLESDIGFGSSSLLALQMNLSQHSRVCSYDRAGYSASQPSALPRSHKRIASEVAQLLHVAGELDHSTIINCVGVGWGGDMCLWLRALYPKLVTHLVLVDPVLPTLKGPCATDSLRVCTMMESLAEVHGLSSDQLATEQRRNLRQLDARRWSSPLALTCATDSFSSRPDAGGFDPKSSVGLLDYGLCHMSSANVHYLELAWRLQTLWAADDPAVDEMDLSNVTVTIVERDIGGICSEGNATCERLAASYNEGLSAALAIQTNGTSRLLCSIGNSDYISPSQLVWNPACRALISGDLMALPRV